MKDSYMMRIVKMLIGKITNTVRAITVDTVRRVPAEVIEADNESQMVIDYNVRNNETYIYRLFASTASYITVPIISEPILTKW